MNKLRLSIALLLTAAFAFSVQGHPSPQQWRRGWGRRQPEIYRPGGDRRGVPNWKNDLEYKQDVFTFCRARFDTYRGWGWRTDYPDSDLNFSFRLQQLTSLKVDPDGKVVDLTDPALFDYPFIYMCEPGDIILSDQEEKALRSYLLNGGFLMCDDFWGQPQWESVEAAFKRVFPNRTPIELPISHPIFRTVFDLKEKPQVPNHQTGEYGRGQGPGGTHISWENREPGSREVHYKRLCADNGRLMAIFCHITDLGDGWEPEGEDEFYFHEYSEKKA
ncbi:MAG: DUF4159 domain-containing protein, partial [Planctomycetaceae bacterium]